MFMQVEVKPHLFTLYSNSDKRTHITPMKFHRMRHFISVNTVCLSKHNLSSIIMSPPTPPPPPPPPPPLATNCVQSCEHNSYNFIQIFLKHYWCFCQGLKMCMPFGCNPQINFCHFCLNLVNFWLNFYQSI